MNRFIALLLVFLSLKSYAQKKQGQARLDSLLAELSKVNTDTGHVKLLSEISFSYCISDPDEGLKYAGMALNAARDNGWKKGEAIALNSLGNNYLNKGAYPQALDHFFRALRIYEDDGGKEAAGAVLLNIGTVYYHQNNFPKALEYYFRSLRSAQEAGDKGVELTAAGNIGNVYNDQGKYQEALVYMQKALNISRELDDKRGIINQLVNIGNVYAALNNLPEALAYYFRSLHLAENAGDRQIIASNQGNIGETYLDLARDTSRTARANKAANLAKATDYLQKGIDGCREVHFNQAIIEFLQKLSEAYALQGNYEAGFAAHQQYSALKDSIFNLENNEKIANLETKRALELKDKDIRIAKLEVAKKRNERRAFIGGIALLLAIMAILFRSFRRQQHSNSSLSKEKKRSDDLLLNILPLEVAEELKDSGASMARQYNEVSVMFTDFVDFTGAAEEMSPQALVKELHECFTAFDAIIGRNCLEKIKTIGDAYMAVCGLPVTDPRHAQKTVQAALEIRDFIKERRRAGRAFEIRIGINSGPVVAGIVGVKKFAYDIWGDTVNTAARMEQHGVAGAINISHATRELVEADYRCEYRGRIAAKNKGEVEMYFVEQLTTEEAAV